jgi:ribosomal protein S18 acetylase RimI-like enzyme
MLVGTVIVGDDGHRGGAYFLAVDQVEPRTELGQEMVSDAENWFRELGAVKILLTVGSTNAVALGFYGLHAVS